MPAEIQPSDMQYAGIKSISSWFKEVGPLTPTYDEEDPESRHIDYTGEGHQFYFGGFAGTGKTSILPHIIDACGIDYADVAFCAPTGKAAKVMSKKLRSAYETLAVSAKTIHSQIYIPMKERVDALRERVRDIESSIKGLTETQMGQALFDPAAFDERMNLLQADLKLAKRDFDEAKRDSDRHGPQFIINPESAVRKSRLIIVDEASMVGESIADDLLSFGIPVLAIGDPAQLPPVGDKPGLTIGEPDFFLTEIHRQAADNPIIRLSMEVRNGKILQPGRMGDQVRIVRRRDDEWTLNPEYDAQVICGTHKKRWTLTKQIREMCGYTSNGPDIDEPLMVCKNSKKAPALVNGSFVTCVESPGNLEDGDASFEISVEDEDGVTYNLTTNQGQFEEHSLRQKDGATASKFAAFDSKRRDEILDWGWVITAHKSQGSQWSNVIVHDESGMFREDASRWAYTAITRASEELTVVVT